MKIIKLKNYLKQPYPYFYNIKSVIQISIVVFLMTLLFNYFFEPFGVNKKELKMSFFFVSLLHAFLPFFIICSGAILLLFKKKIVNQWTIKSEIIYIFFILLIIGISQFLIRDIIYNNPNNWSWRYFFEEIRNTFLAGILFLAIIIPIVHNYYLKKHQKTVKNIIPFNKETTLFNSGNILIKTQLKAETFHLNPYVFLFALSEGNYTEFYFLEDHTLKKKLLRVSLKNLEKQLSTYKFISRTHRSYIVNLKQIKHVEGNAQGLKLSFNIGEEKALVSRKMITTFKKNMSLFQN